MIYDVFLLFFILFSLPGVLWRKLRHGVKVPILDRFGCRPPLVVGSGKRIWIHAVSVGEVKAAAPLFWLLREQDPSTVFLITTITATGQEEARRSLSGAQWIRFLPLDFSWIMRRWVHSFRPDLLIFVEGDLWPNLLREAKNSSVKSALVSGKISERSASRFRYFPSISRRLFGSLDLLCVQNEEQRVRFSSLTHQPLFVTGNLKLDHVPEELKHIYPNNLKNRFWNCAESRELSRGSKTDFSGCLGMQDRPRVMTIACTHAPEERELLHVLRMLWEKYPDLCVFLAPRHPERCGEVAALLSRLGCSFCLWSRWNGGVISDKVILVDVMGQLSRCYSVSHLAVLGGSFSSRIGGHNVVEPCLYGCPVIFGPWMHSQRELAELTIASGAGVQVSADQLLATLEYYFDPLHAAELNRFRLNAKELSSHHCGVATRTLECLQKHLEEIPCSVRL